LKENYYPIKNNGKMNQPRKEEFKTDLKMLDFLVISTDGSELEDYICDNIVRISKKKNLIKKNFS